MALVYSIIAEHDGKIDIDSPLPGQAKGTQIRLWLPLNRQEVAPADEPDPDR